VATEIVVTDQFRDYRKMIAKATALWNEYLAGK
jgi:hypothetical protein